ncbi:hypothetical protein GF376_01815 [Candidatus Peregrinibacteria bacterium]|nr:hypothetical protein [Candidatus Peregrinibacteria bacterium]
MKEFSIIATMDQKNGISKENRLPWYLPEDIKYFKEITTKTQSNSLQNAIIMDYYAWQNYDFIEKPLKSRVNIVVEVPSDIDLPMGVIVLDNLEQALAAVDSSEKIDQVFVIGGKELYDEAVLHPSLKAIFLTKIEEDFDCDSFFPDQIPESMEIASASEILDNEDIEYSHFILQH